MNFVWNWCNEAQKLAIRHNKKWPRGFDLNKLPSGCSSEVDLHSQTSQEICEKYVDSRNTGERSASGIGERNPGDGFHSRLPGSGSGMDV